MSGGPGLGSPFAAQQQVLLPSVVACAPLAVEPSSAMDLNHPLLQADFEPKPFPESQPQLRRLDKAMLCPICKELFDHPVTIGCGHSFCSKCIRGYFASAKKSVCPTCSDPQTEGSIRRNRVLEEMCDAWEEARPTLVDLVQPPPSRKRRNSIPRRSPSKKTRGEGSTRSSPYESRAPSDDDDSDVVELAESDEGECPICGALLQIAAIPGHIDRGCPKPKPSSTSSSNQKLDWKRVFAGSGSAKAKETEFTRIKKPNYSLISLSDLKGLLMKYELSTSGDRPALEARFQQWTVMYNANMDSSHPASLSKLRADLERAEASRRRDKERGKDDEVEALQTSDGLKKYAAEHKSDFERLRQDILERKRRKSQGGLKESPIEVE